MRRMVVTCSILALVLVATLHGQESKSARGTVTAVAGDTLSVKAGARELKFVLDAKTMVVASGGGTAERAAQAKGTPGPKASDLLKVGDAVDVTYRESGGMLHATNVRRTSSAGSGGGGTSDQRAASKSETVNGTVTAVSASSMTITGSASGGATFTQTYTIDTSTKVIGAGAGTAAAKGKVTILDLVKKGDRVTVTFEPSGSTVRASEVRVRNTP